MHDHLQNLFTILVIVIFFKNKFQNKNKIILKINYVTKRLSKLAIINWNTYKKLTYKSLVSNFATQKLRMVFK